MQFRRFLLCLFLAASTLPAMALDRLFPPNVKRGTMSPAAYPEIVINGTARRLAVGARLRNQENRLELPASLRAGVYAIHYTEDGAGEISAVWILTDEEAGKPLPTSN